MSEQRRIGYKWNLRQQMAQRNLWKTTELVPLLKSHGPHLLTPVLVRSIRQAEK